MVKVATSKVRNVSTIICKLLDVDPFLYILQISVGDEKQK